MKRKFILFILFIAIILSGCEIYNDIESSDENTPVIIPNSLKDSFNIKLYYPDKGNEKLLAKNIKINDITKKIEIEVLEKLINDNYTNNLIPDNTRVRSIDIENQIAYINFSNDIKKNEVTEKEEVMLIYSIVNTMCELDSISAVQILIDGEKEEIFKNIFSIENPIKYSKLIVDNEYIDPLITIKRYYDILNNKEITNLATLFKNTDKKSRVYYEMQYVDKNIKEYSIESYKINKYKESILVDVTVKRVTNDNKEDEFNEVFSMIYNNFNEENIFKINEIY